MTNVTILNGDCRDVLKTLPEKSIHCCVTSPPYFGLRSYLPDTVQINPNLSDNEKKFILNELKKLNIFPF